jgi:hypothetical protein
MAGQQKEETELRFMVQRTGIVPIEKPLIRNPKENPQKMRVVSQTIIEEEGGESKSANPPRQNPKREQLFLGEDEAM